MSRIWIFADYSQAEARVVAWKGPVPALREWFMKGEDVHTNVARLIGQAVQENKIQMPRRLFMTKPWNEYGKGDVERQLAKNTVHANNYGMGRQRFSLITGLPLKYAETVQDIYFQLFPEVRTGYQAGIDTEIWATRTLWLPYPYRWRKVFYGAYGPELSRAAYAFYAQSTIGALMTATFNSVCTIFSQKQIQHDIDSPWNIRACGLDVQLQLHDAIGISIEDDPSTVRWVVEKVKSLGESTIIINGEPLVIPMDFKTGRSWGELEDYKL